MNRTMTLKHIILTSTVAASTLMSMACGGEVYDAVQQRWTTGDPDDAVCFSATLSDAATRSSDAATRSESPVPAPGELTLAALQDGTDGFGVYGVYTGMRRYVSSTVSPDFLCNQQVVWSAVLPQTEESWTYSPLKYWPNGEGEATGESQGEIPHYVSFFAYAPWSNLQTTGSSHQPANCIIDSSQPYDQGDPWLTYRLAEDPLTEQVDLLYALPLIDQTKPETAERLLFTFRHALGCVGNTVRLQCDADLQGRMRAKVNGTTVVRDELILNSITVDYVLTSKGRLYLWNQGEPNWHTITSENVKTTRQVSWTDLDHIVYAYNGTNEDGTAWAGQGKGIFYIPIEGDDYVQRATITVDYTLRTYSTYISEGNVGNVYTDHENQVQAILILREQRDGTTGESLYGPGLKMDFRLTLDDTSLFISTTSFTTQW